MPFIDVKPELDWLIANHYLVSAITQIGVELTLTNKALQLIETLDGQFTNAKKRTDTQIMGSEFMEKIEEYRQIFPSGMLPSGKPGRQNVKALAQSFRWFFETYNFTWPQILTATKMYVNEYKDNDYLYMMTSQYFISKQDKNKVKQSTLADYCDMIAEGVTDNKPKPFKENVV